LAAAARVWTPAALRWVVVVVVGSAWKPVAAGRREVDHPSFEAEGDAATEEILPWIAEAADAPTSGNHRWIAVAVAEAPSRRAPWG
jgi:hypothetical protein